MTQHSAHSVEYSLETRTKRQHRIGSSAASALLGFMKLVERTVGLWIMTFSIAKTALLRNRPTEVELVCYVTFRPVSWYAIDYH